MIVDGGQKRPGVPGGKASELEVLKAEGTWASVLQGVYPVLQIPVTGTGSLAE